MRLLVSVRSETEALLAAQGGVDFIDLKEPREARCGPPVASVRAIVRTLRGRASPCPSATIGDLPCTTRPIVASVDAVAACGVDYVKVGIERGPGPLPWTASLRAATPSCRYSSPIAGSMPSLSHTPDT
jgi:uncharacterized protein (UPF0264 family)